MIQAAFHEGYLAEKCTWKTVVLIPKGNGKDFRRIGLVGVLWMIVTGILNFRLAVAIQIHDALHRFRTGRGTSTTSLEANMIQNLTEIREELIYDIFLDIHKAYCAVYFGRCLEILAAYGVVPWEMRLLWRYWGRLPVVSRSDGYYRFPFKGHRGVTQEDPLSPTIFNVMVDVFLRNWASVVEEVEGDAGPESFGRDVHRLVAYLYAENGLLDFMRVERILQVFHVMM